MNIKEIRQKYPEYDHASDQELADALHKKYYSHVPAETFYEKIGFKTEPSSFSQMWNKYVNRELSPEESEEKKNMQDPIGSLLDRWKNIGQGAKDIYGQATNYISELPQKGGESIEQIARDPSRAALNVAAGATSGVKGLINTPGFLAENILKYGGGKLGKALSVIPRNLQIGNTGVQEAILGQSQKGDELLDLAGALTTGLNPGKVAQIGMKNLNRLKGMEGGRIGDAINKIKNPEKLMSSNLSPEELQRNLRIAGETQTPLGSILGSPSLKEFQEDILAPTPFSGVKETFKKTGQDISNQGEELLNKIAGGAIPENIPAHLMKKIQDEGKAVTAEKDNLFKQRNELAAAHNVKTTRPLFREKAEKLLGQIKNDEVSSSLMDQSDINLLKRIAGTEDKYKIDYSTGAKIHPEFSVNTPVLLKQLGDRGYAAYLKGERGKATIFNNLKKALTNDIDNAIEGSGVPELKGLHEKAYDYYKKNYTKYDKPEVQKILKGDFNSDELLAKYLKTGGRVDRSNQLQKLMDLVPAKERNLVAYDYYSNAVNEGALNPQKLSTLHKKLGERQKKVLLNDDLQKKVSDFSKLVEMNPEAFTTMFNPKTGARVLASLALIGGGGGGALGATLGGVLGSLGLGAAGAAGAIPAGILLARHFNRKLTDPSFRRSVISEIEKKRNKTMSSQEKAEFVKSIGKETKQHE